MVIDFVPQFHKKIAHSDGRNAWVAMPLPKTLIPEKTGYYRAWQREECLRLRRAGERIVAMTPGGDSTTEVACGPLSHCQGRDASFRTPSAHCAAS